MNLSPDQIDALKELITIGVGKAASMLNQLIYHRIWLQVPSIKVFSLSEAKREMGTLFKDRLATVQIPFTGLFAGKAAMVFPSESASNLVTVLTGEEPSVSDLDSVRSGTLNEVGNILINGIMGSLGNIFKKRIAYSFPRYTEETIDSLFNQDDIANNAYILLARTSFTIKEFHVEGDIVLLFEVTSFETLLSSIENILMEQGACE